MSLIVKSIYARAKPGKPRAIVVIGDQDKKRDTEYTTSNLLIEAAFLPALLTGATVDQVITVAHTNELQRVYAYGSGKKPLVKFAGNYVVSRIATQRRDDGTDEHLEVFLVPSLGGKETQFNVHDPLIQQVFLAAFSAKLPSVPAPTPVPVEVAHEDVEVIAVRLGEA